MMIYIPILILALINAAQFAMIEELREDLDDLHYIVKGDDARP
jgi:hypothetical protein